MSPYIFRENCELKICCKTQSGVEIGTFLTYQNNIVYYFREFCEMFYKIFNKTMNRNSKLPVNPSAGTTPAS